MPAPPLADIKAANARLKDGRMALLALSRPLGPYLAWVAIRVGLTPRQVNYFSLSLVGFLLGLVALGDDRTRAVGLALVFLWQVIDVTDGTMARAQKIRDNFGGFVDFATGMVAATFLPFCLGIGLSRRPDGSLAALLGRLGVTPDDPGRLVLVAAAGISVISLYIRLISRVLVIRFGESVDSLAASRAAERPPNWFQTVARNLETLGGAQAFVFFGGAALGQLELVVIGYALFYVAILAAFAVSTHRTYRDRTRYLTD
jgi:phosphatidylglycerophosphate synthase